MKAVSASPTQRSLVPPALSEAMHVGIDDLPFVDLPDRSAIQLLHVDLTQGLWVVRVRFEPGCQITTHYHSGCVFAVTAKGRWFYSEYPDVINQPGSYLFEPAGSVHTLTIPADQKGPTEVWFAVFGSNLNIGDNSEVVGIVDASTILRTYRSRCRERGLSTDKLIVFGEPQK